jgi:hypothetical protein
MSERDELIAALAGAPEMDAFLEVRDGREIIDAIKALIGRSPAEPKLYDKPEFEVWRKDVTRDDWMSRFTSVDIREMLIEIERLSHVPASDDFLDNNAAMLGLSASDAAAYKWPDDTEIARECRKAFVAGAIAYASPPVVAGVDALRGMETALLSMENAHSRMANGAARDDLYSGIVSARSAIANQKDGVRDEDWDDIENHAETEFGKPVRRLVHSPKLGIREGDVSKYAGMVHVSVYGMHGDAVKDWGVTKFKPMPAPPLGT